MTASQHERAERFARLHAEPGVFVLPNAWDAGSARIIAAHGFAALATTSSGLAFALARRDGKEAVSRDEALANAAAIVEATELPVSADLEGGYGATPEDVAETMRRAADVGLVGCTLEDSTADPAQPIRDLEDAVARVRAAVTAADGLPHPFLIAARSENFLHGRPDLEDTIRRLQAFEAVGAHVLYAPGLPDLAAVRAVCNAVSRPVNVLPHGTWRGISVADIGAAGAKRVSLGSTLNRVALGALDRAASALSEGSLGFNGEAMPFADVTALMD